MTPFSRLLPPDRGSRPRNLFNQLVALTAVFGIGAGGWGLWLEKAEHDDRRLSRQRIRQACAGLVDPDRVLDLNGGTPRAIVGGGANDSFTPESLDAPENLPARCVIYRVGAPGTSYAHFTLSVHTNPSTHAANVVGDTVHPFENRADDNATDLTRQADHSPDYPLDYPAEDDGRLGHYNDDSATFKVRCKRSATAKKNVTSVNVVTEAPYDDVSFTDRLTLIELASAAAYKAADRVGCTPTKTYPSSYARLWIPDPELKDAYEAEGSCRWYAVFLGLEGDLGRLPDRALGARNPGEHTFKETCLLAASPAQVRRVWPELPKQRILTLDAVLDHSPWYLQTDSFFGDEAREVQAQAFGGDRTDLRPGTAGRAELAPVWWASSTCDGEPAVHTLTVSGSYEKAIAPRLRPLFQAYVDHITAARDCTEIEFPPSSAFFTA